MSAHAGWRARRGPRRGNASSSSPPSAILRRVRPGVVTPCSRRAVAVRRGTDLQVRSRERIDVLEWRASARTRSVIARREAARGPTARSSDQTRRRELKSTCPDAVRSRYRDDPAQRAGLRLRSPDDTRRRARRSRRAPGHRRSAYLSISNRRDVYSPRADAGSRHCGADRGRQ